MAAAMKLLELHNHASRGICILFWHGEHNGVFGRGPPLLWWSCRGIDPHTTAVRVTVHLASAFASTLVSVDQAQDLVKAFGLASLHYDTRFAAICPPPDVPLAHAYVTVATTLYTMLLKLPLWNVYPSHVLMKRLADTPVETRDCAVGECHHAVLRSQKRRSTACYTLFIPHLEGTLGFSHTLASPRVNQKKKLRALSRLAALS